MICATQPQDKPHHAGDDVNESVANSPLNLFEMFYEHIHVNQCSNPSHVFVQANLELKE